MQYNPFLRRRFLLSTSALALTCIAPGAFHPASAETIDDKITTPVSTSTIKNNGRDDITISADGVVEIKGGDDIAAVTLDSDNRVVNEGDIVLHNVDGGRGVFIDGARKGVLRSNGDIIVSEDYERKDNDDDKDLDGPYAMGKDRVGVLLGGDGAFDGDMAFGAKSKITVQGNQSAGVRLEKHLDGAFKNDGAISVVGDDAVGVDIRDGVSGPILQSGAISVRGKNARGVVIRGKVDGAVTNESTITATGFGSTSKTNYADPDLLDKDDTPIEDRIDAEELLDGGPALSIGGAVRNGFLNNGKVDTFVSDANKEDKTKDTVEDFDENRGTGVITSYGSGPAVLVSPDLDPDTKTALVLGPVVERVRDTLDDDEDGDTEEIIAVFEYDAGFINRGSIIANGLNVGFEATALRIEGAAEGDQLTIVSGGIQNGGSILADAFEADATAVSIGRNAIIGTIENSGTIDADVVTETDHKAIAVLIEQGADVDTIRNKGAITASSQGFAGTAAGIVDRSGGLKSIDNQGVISAIFLADEEKDEGLGHLTAIDLRTVASGARIVQTRQTPVDDINEDGKINDRDVITPEIIGDVYLGAGDDLIDVRAGAVSGALYLGAGDDSVVIADAELRGDVHFGAGADAFTLRDGAVFAGALIDPDETLTVIIEDATFSFTGETAARVRSLTVSGKSLFAIDADARDADVSSPRVIVNGDAAFSADAEVRATIKNFVNEEVSLTLIEAGSLSVEGGGADNITVSAPAIYKRSVDIDADSLAITLAPKTANDLGLNEVESAAFSSLLDIAEANDKVGAGLSSFIEEDALVSGYRQLLPDYSGAMTRFLSNELSIATGVISARLDQVHLGGAGFWLQQSASYTNESESNEKTGYDGLGISFHAGYDYALAKNLTIGGAGAFRIGKFSMKKGLKTDVESTAYDFNLYTAYTLGGFRLDASGAVGRSNFYSDRRVAFGDAPTTYEGRWNGFYYAGSGRLSYEMAFGSFYARPAVSIDYFSLSEDDYEETSEMGDSLYALSVGEADTDRTSGAAILKIGRRTQAKPRRWNTRFGPSTQAPSPRRIVFQNAYAGYRNEFNNSRYATTARFLEGERTFGIADPTDYDDAVLFGLAVGAAGEGYALSINYDGELAGDYSIHRLAASFRLTF